jgi:hypothetical protein
MPNLDQTGPQGKGPKTGRGLGKCQNQNRNQENSDFPRNSRRGNRQRLNQRDASCLRNNQKTNR